MHSGSYSETRGHTPPLELLEVSLDEVESVTDTGGVSGQRHWRPWLLAGALGLVALAAIALWRAAAEPAAAEGVPEPLTIVPAEPAIPVPPDGIVGFAELYVAAYLTATGAARQATIERYFPAAPDMVSRQAFDRYVTQAVVVAVEHAGAEVWTLDVAVEVLTFDGAAYVLDGLHHYAVAVSAPDGGPLAATSLPMRIAAPPAGEVAAVVIGTPVADPSLEAVASGFVRAYVAGSEELFRYTAAEFGPDAISPPPFTRVTVEDLTAVQIAPDRVHVRLAGTGVPANGAPIRIEYHLVIAIEGGAWKVVAIAPGPLTAGQLSAAEAAVSKN